MDDLRFGHVVRAVRIKRGWRQADVAAAADVSRSVISRMERGHLDTLSLRAVRRVGAALDVRIDLMARWRAGDLDRLLNARHSALHEAVARSFVNMPAWDLVPEVSFSVYGERGVIDLLAWHAATGSVIVIELKTDIVDVQELLGTLDRKRRLAERIARERGWHPRSISRWVIVSDSRTNRRRVQAHAAVLRLVLPLDGRAVARWLGAPVGELAALSFWTDVRGGNVRGPLATTRRVRKRSESSPRAQIRSAAGDERRGTASDHA